MLPPDLRAVLPDATEAAWPKVVAALPAGAYLAGGTALAMHLGHRVSRDLDLFVDRPFNTSRVRTVLERSGDLTVTTFTNDTLNGLLDGTRVQCLEAASLQLLDPPTVVASMTSLTTPACPSHGTWSRTTGDGANPHSSRAWAPCRTHTVSDTMSHPLIRRTLRHPSHGAPTDDRPSRPQPARRPPRPTGSPRARLLAGTGGEPDTVDEDDDLAVAVAAAVRSILATAGPRSEADLTDRLITDGIADSTTRTWPSNCSGTSPASCRCVTGGWSTCRPSRRDARSPTG